MFKRTFWFTTGATAGFGGAMWVRRQVLRTVRRFAPEQVQAEVTTSVRRLGSDLRAAVSEGRTSMADREAQLRSELSPGAGPRPVASAVATAASPVPPEAAVATRPAAASRWRPSRRRVAPGRRAEPTIGEPARHH